MTDGTHRKTEREMKMSTDPEGWITYAKNEHKVILLDADWPAFVYYAETDDFDSGHTWLSHSPDPESGWLTTAHATDGLIERRFNEAVPEYRAWIMDPENTPLRENEYVTR